MEQTQWYKDGVFYQTTPAYGGKLLARIVIPTARPQMVTVHPQICQPLEPVPDKCGEVIEAAVDVTEDECFELLETSAFEGERVALSKAPVIIAGGRGIKQLEDLDQLREIADLLYAQYRPGMFPILFYGARDEDLWDRTEFSQPEDRNGTGRAVHPPVCL